jgi:hypothetical protein
MPVRLGKICANPEALFPEGVENLLDDVGFGIFGEWTSG